MARCFCVSVYIYVNEQYQNLPKCLFSHFTVYSYTVNQTSTVTLVITVDSNNKYSKEQINICIPKYCI